MIHFARWKTLLIVAISLGGVLLSVPNFLAKGDRAALPDWLPSNTVYLGLDLQGGAHLLLQTDIASVLRERLDGVVHSTRAALRSNKIGYTELGVKGEGVAFALTDPDFEADTHSILRREVNVNNDYDVTVENEGGVTRFALSYNPFAIRRLTDAIMEQSIEVVRSRVDETGTSEPVIQRQGDDRILVQLPGEDPERIKRLLGKTAKLTFHLLDPTTTALAQKRERVPPGTFIAPAYGVSDDESVYLVRRRMELSGERLDNAVASFDSNVGQYVVNISFDSLGARQFGRVTRASVNRRLAVLLDGKVVTAPVIREPILGGNARIDGDFSAEEANELALVLRAGALPAPLNILEERSVGPSLGADSVAAGRMAGLLGLLLVALFMPLAYGLFGLFANVALLVNLLLILGVLSSLQVTLTLPGIAGIVLTLGMAVDANVLVFERIREELRAGRTPVNAVDHGYDRAWRTIVDANVTTLIAAALLYLFGSGPVKGFAVTLSIGIATSMFTAIMLTRLMIVSWLRRSRRQALPL